MIISLMKEQEQSQFYLPVEGGEYTCSAEDLKAGLIASVKERVSPYTGGTVFHLDLEAPGVKRQSFKLNGQLTEALREGKVDLTKVKVAMPSIVITKLKKTSFASKEMREFITRANFDWTI